MYFYFSYVVAIGLVERMAHLLASIRGSLETNNAVMSFAEETLVLLNFFVRASPYNAKDPGKDITRMMETIR